MARTTVILIVVVVFFCGTAFARDRDLGMGIVLGDPTGLSVKKWLGGTYALDGAAAWAFGTKDSLHLHVDLLYHSLEFFKVKKGKIHFYYGIGGRFKIGYEDRFGLRLPAGISYVFKKDPLDVFFEIVPVLDLAPDTNIDFNAGVGVRYYPGHKRWF